MAISRQKGIPDTPGTTPLTTPAATPLVTPATSPGQTPENEELPSFPLTDAHSDNQNVSDCMGDCDTVLKIVLTYGTLAIS